MISPQTPAGAAQRSDPLARRGAGGTAAQGPTRPPRRRSAGSPPRTPTSPRASRDRLAALAARSGGRAPRRAPRARLGGARRRIAPALRRRECRPGRAAPPPPRRSRALASLTGLADHAPSRRTTAKSAAITAPATRSDGGALGSSAGITSAREHLHRAQAELVVEGDEVEGRQQVVASRSPRSPRCSRRTTVSGPAADAEVREEAVEGELLDAAVLGDQRALQVRARARASAPGTAARTRPGPARRRRRRR